MPEPDRCLPAAGADALQPGAFLFLEQTPQKWRQRALLGLEDSEGTSYAGRQSGSHSLTVPISHRSLPSHSARVGRKHRRIALVVVGGFCSIRPLGGTAPVNSIAINPQIKAYEYTRTHDNAAARLPPEECLLKNANNPIV